MRIDGPSKALTALGHPHTPTSTLPVVPAALPANHIICSSSSNFGISATPDTTPTTIPTSYLIAAPTLAPLPTLNSVNTAVSSSTIPLKFNPRKSAPRRIIRPAKTRTRVTKGSSGISTRIPNTAESRIKLHQHNTVGGGFNATGMNTVGDRSDTDIDMDEPKATVCDEFGTSRMGIDNPDIIINPPSVVPTPPKFVNSSKRTGNKSSTAMYLQSQLLQPSAPTTSRAIPMDLSESTPLMPPTHPAWVNPDAYHQFQVSRGLFRTRAAPLNYNRAMSGVLHSTQAVNTDTHNSMNIERLSTVGGGGFQGDALDLNASMDVSSSKQVFNSKGLVGMKYATPDLVEKLYGGSVKTVADAITTNNTISNTRTLLDPPISKPAVKSKKHAGTKHAAQGLVEKLPGGSVKTATKAKTKKNTTPNALPDVSISKQAVKSKTLCGEKVSAVEKVRTFGERNIIGSRRSAAGSSEELLMGFSNADLIKELEGRGFVVTLKGGTNVPVDGRSKNPGSVGNPIQLSVDGGGGMGNGIATGKVVSGIRKKKKVAARHRNQSAAEDQIDPIIKKEQDPTTVKGFLGAITIRPLPALVNTGPVEIVTKDLNSKKVIISRKPAAIPIRGEALKVAHSNIAETIDLTGIASSSNGDMVHIAGNIPQNIAEIGGGGLPVSTRFNTQQLLESSNMKNINSLVRGQYKMKESRALASGGGGLISSPQIIINPTAGGNSRQVALNLQRLGQDFAIPTAAVCPTCKAAPESSSQTILVNNRSKDKTDKIESTKVSDGGAENRRLRDVPKQITSKQAADQQNKQNPDVIVVDNNSPETVSKASTETKQRRKQILPDFMPLSSMAPEPGSSSIEAIKSNFMTFGSQTGGLNRRSTDTTPVITDTLSYPGQTLDTRRPDSATITRNGPNTPQKSDGHVQAPHPPKNQAKNTNSCPAKPQLKKDKSVPGLNQPADTILGGGLGVPEAMAGVLRNHNCKYPLRTADALRKYTNIRLGSGR